MRYLFRSLQSGLVQHPGDVRWLMDGLLSPKSVPKSDLAWRRPVQALKRLNLKLGCRAINSARAGANTSDREDWWQSRMDFYAPGLQRVVRASVAKGGSSASLSLRHEKVFAARP